MASTSGPAAPAPTPAPLAAPARRWGKTRWLTAVVTPLLAISLVSCSDDDTPTTPAASSTTAAPVTSPTPSSTTQPPTTTAVTAPAPLLEQVPQVALQPVATAQAPIAMSTRADTTNLYIAERAGRVRVLDPASGRLSDPIIDISGDVSTDGERGLLGLAFTPDGARLYLSYTNRSGDSRVDEYTMNGDALDLASKRTLFAVDQPASNHNGGNVVFGPDGMLWFGLGDGGGSGDRFGHGQNPETLLGSLLRVDVTTRDAGEYGIPADNPFVNGGGRPEVWLFGVRNPWRFSFDRSSGDLWIGDVGQNTVEEIDVLRAPDLGRGANLQWPLREGFREFAGAAPEGSVDPIYEYDRSDGSCSITGGYVYRGAAIPALQGVYVFGDYCEGTLRGLFQGPNSPEERPLGANAGRGALVSFGEDSSGELYTLGIDGTIARIVPA